MTREEGTLSERVGARISPELKERVQEAIAKHGYDSEADVVRAALWMYVDQNEPAEQPSEAVHQQPKNLTDSDNERHHDEKRSTDRVEWALTVVVILIALVGSKILNTIRDEKIKPAELADEAIQETIYNWSIFWQKMRAGRQAVEYLVHHEPKN